MIIVLHKEAVLAEVRSRWKKSSFDQLEWKNSIALLTHTCSPGFLLLFLFFYIYIFDSDPTYLLPINKCRNTLVWFHDLSLFYFLVNLFHILENSCLYLTHRQRVIQTKLPNFVQVEKRIHG